jgi:hypothetical protein
MRTLPSCHGGIVPLNKRQRPWVVHVFNVLFVLRALSGDED